MAYELDSLDVRKIVSEFKAQSLANGQIMVTPTYVPEPIEEGATSVGVLDRMTLAVVVEEVMNHWLWALPEGDNGNA